MPQNNTLRSPLSLDDFLPYRLSYTSNLISERIAQTYEMLFGLTIPEWRLIAVIAETPGVTQQAICARTRMDKVTVSRAAVALAERKLIARSPNAGDKRSHLLGLTPHGLALYRAVAPKAIEMEASALACLSADEKRLLKQLLGRIDKFVLGVSEPR